MQPNFWIGKTSAFYKCTDAKMLGSWQFAFGHLEDTLLVAFFIFVLIKMKNSIKYGIQKLSC